MKVRPYIYFVKHRIFMEWKGLLINVLQHEITSKYKKRNISATTGWILIKNKDKWSKLKGTYPWTPEGLITVIFILIELCTNLF